MNDIRRKRQHEEFVKASPYNSEEALKHNQMFQGLQSWLNGQVKTIKKKVTKEMIRNKEGSIRMANTKGQMETFTVPADLKHLVNQRKLNKRAVNISMM